MPNDPVSVVDGSAIATFTTTSAHSLSIGDVIQIDGLTKGKSWTSAEINQEHVIATVPSTTTFTVNLGRNSKKTGSFGGLNGNTRQVFGRGLGRLWTTLDGTSSSVLTTGLGSKAYNFIIVQDLSNQGWVCYDTTDALATFSALTNPACQTSGVATGSCVCK